MRQARNDPPVGTNLALAGKRHGFGCVSKWCKALSLRPTGQRNANGFQVCAPGFMKCWRSKPRANFVNMPKRQAFPSMRPGSSSVVIERARSAGATACLQHRATCVLHNEVYSCIRLSSVRLEAAPLPDVVYSFCVAQPAAESVHSDVYSWIWLSSVRLQAAPLPDVMHLFVQPCVSNPIGTPAQDTAT